MHVLGIAATGLEALQKTIDVTANNIANADSLAFKKLQVNTTDLTYNVLRNPGAEPGTANSQPIGTYIGSGTRVTGTQRILKQGDVGNTGKPLDLLIHGSGYFAINLPNGRQAFTRVGNFEINKNRKIVNTEGYELSDDITIGDNIQLNDIEIDKDGSVNIKNGTQGVGRITLYNFANENALEPYGEGLYLATDGSGEAIQYSPNTDNIGHLEQHCLEQSNVNATEELIKLITAQRLYEMNMKVVKVADSMMQSSIDLIK